MATEKTETRDVWFVLFSAGDGRFNHYGWTAYWKDEVENRAAAKRGGDRCAHRWVKTVSRCTTVSVVLM